MILELIDCGQRKGVQPFFCLPSLKVTINAPLHQLRPNINLSLLTGVEEAHDVI